MSSITPGKELWLAVGARFNAWTVIGPPIFSQYGKVPRRYLCRCDCGTEKEIGVHDLVGLRTKWCLKCRSRGEGNTRYRHGATKARWHSKLYMVWSSVKARCKNPKNKDWEYYGGRGITLCEEWLDFAVFQAWAMANGYQEGLELDRAENTQGYAPDNCRFVTHAKNSGNRGDRRWWKRPKE